MLQCGECKFLGWGYKKDCFYHGKGSRQAQGAMKEKEVTTSWNKNKSTKKEDKDEGKGWDWSKSIQGMNFDKAQAWFKDYENCYDSYFSLLFALAFVLHFLLMPFFSHDDHLDYESLSNIPLPSDRQPCSLCSDYFRYLPRTIYLIELPPTFRYYVAWSVCSTL